MIFAKYEVENLAAIFDAYYDSGSKAYAENASEWEVDHLGYVYQGVVNSIITDKFPKNYEEVEIGWNVLRSDFAISTLDEADDYIEKPHHYGRDVLIAILHTMEDAMGLDQEDYTDYSV